MLGGPGVFVLLRPRRANVAQYAARGDVASFLCQR